MPSAPFLGRLKTTLSKHLFSWGSLAIVLVATVVTVISSLFLYQFTVDLLTQRLRDRLVAIVQTAAVQFEAGELEELQTTNDYRKPEWQRVVTRLQKVRSNNPDVVFAYLLRKSADDPSKILFVADADSLDPFAKIDLNHDGVINDADALAAPGDEYEDAPEEIFEGFSQPTTNRELYEDQWGILLSGYAPIHDASGSTVAVMAIDIRADNFAALTQQTLRPFLIFIAFLLAIITLQAVMLRQFWKAQVRQLQEIDRQKDELLSIVSHQLGGPITTIRWGLECLRDGDAGPLSPNQTAEITTLMERTGGLSELVGLLLESSRIDLGRLSVQRERVELRAFFADIKDVISALARQKGVDLLWNVPRDLPAANLDRRLTRMTLENLLNNAVKYTPTGGSVRFDIQIQNGRLRCEVTDTGVGIPKEDQKQLFTKLFRASNVRDKIEGNGFGLYIAKGAIEQQGGTIRCESEVGRGTTFTIELPI